MSINDDRRLRYYAAPYNVTLLSYAYHLRAQLRLMSGKLKVVVCGLHEKLTQ